MFQILCGPCRFHVLSRNNPAPTLTFRAEKFDSQQTQSVDVGNADYSCSIILEPAGVVAAIVPWNCERFKMLSFSLEAKHLPADPLLMATWKIAPVLAAGCTIVLKPSELSPMTALMLGKIITDLGLPKGSPSHPPTNSVHVISRAKNISNLFLFFSLGSHQGWSTLLRAGDLWPAQRSQDTMMSTRYK